MKNTVKQSKSLKSIASFFNVIELIGRFGEWVAVLFIVCVVGVLILNGVFESTVIEENVFKLLMKDLDLAGCQESRNKLIKKVNSGIAIKNGDASNSRSECEEELRQTAYKAQQKAIADGSK